MKNLKKNLHVKEILKSIGLENGMIVGDFGCGLRGTFTFAAADIVEEDGTVFSVDILKDILQTIEGQSKIDGYDSVIKTIWSDMERFKATAIDDESLDVGILVNILFQNRNQDNILKEANRMIKQGGTLFVADWVDDSPLVKTEIKTLVNKKKIIQSAQNLGLTLVKEYTPWDYHFGLIFKKQ